MNIPLTYLATVQPEEVYIQRDYKTERVGKECEALAVEIATEIASAAKPGHLGYKGWKAGSIL